MGLADDKQNQSKYIKLVIYLLARVQGRNSTCRPRVS